MGSWLCKLFGHRMPRQGWWGDGLYGRVTGGYRDGIGRMHFEVRLKCPRCEQEWTTARFHGSQVALQPKEPNQHG